MRREERKGKIFCYLKMERKLLSVGGTRRERKNALVKLIFSMLI